MQTLLSERLFNEFIKGDENAFSLIFKRYFERLFQFAKTYVLDEAVAKNIAQDVFMKIWEKRQSIENSSLFVSFLLTITKNKCLDYLKHVRIEQRYKDQLLLQQSELELNYYALKRLEIDFLDYNEIMKIIENTLLKLPKRCQEVFRLSRFDNLSNSEIAEKLGIGQKAVEANITRAIKIFRKELKDYLVILLILNIPISW